LGFDAIGVTTSTKWPEMISAIASAFASLKDILSSWTTKSRQLPHKKKAGLVSQPGFEE
jgi:hypothetical protein